MYSSSEFTEVYTFWENDTLCTHARLSTFKFKFIVLIVSDINECAEMNGGCQQLCFTTNGSRLCSCKNGYTLHSDGYSCDGEYHTPTASWPSPFGKVTVNGLEKFLSVCLCFWSYCCTSRT